jgi:hypothetical protein
MTAPPVPDSLAALLKAIRRAHRSALVTLVACAVAIALSAEADAAPPAPGVDGFTYAATALALVSILTRRRQPGRPDGVRAHVAFSLVSLVAAAGVGGVGVAAAIAGTPRNAALIYVLAGAIFALRPPLGIAAGAQRVSP